MPKKEIIQEMFDSIAPEYDAFNHLASLGIDRCWRRRALRFVGKAAGASPDEALRVLDIACGTGDFSIAVARRLQKTCGQDWQVVGCDISEGMLAVMREKVAGAGLSAGDAAAPGAEPCGKAARGISTMAGDASAMPFPDRSFDTVTVAFGVRNFEDREKCLREILRVLEPGGRFVMLELGVPSSRSVRWLYKIYFTRIMPWLGGRMSGNRNAYRYLPASVLAFPGKAEWLGTMERCGFVNCRHRALSLGICRLYTGEKPWNGTGA